MDSYTNSPVLLSLPQAARELGVCESTVRRWIKGGVLPALVVGPGRRYRVEAANVAGLRHRDEGLGT